MYISQDYIAEENQLVESLVNSGLVRGSLSNDCLYSLSIVFYLKENLGRRDLDNMLKAPVDVLSKYLGFNDNRIISYKVCKRMISDVPDDEPDLEWMYFCIEKVYKKPKDLTIKFDDFKDFIRQRTGHEILYKLSNKLEGK